MMTLTQAIKRIETTGVTVALVDANTYRLVGKTATSRPLTEAQIIALAEQVC